LLERSLIQERNNITDNKADLKPLLQLVLQNRKLRLIFASKFVKQVEHDCFAKNGTLISSGTGQTSRERFSASRKRKTFGFDLHGASMASDAFSFQIVYNWQKKLALQQ
jgi:phosphoribosylaminoimidazolecarboxamide formyltransferase/IMP cyclohydrolase